MIRLILHLLKIRDYESCKSCETLKAQLEFANSEKKELLETLLLLTKPVVVTQAAEVKVLHPMSQVGGSFARRRGILEQMERDRAEKLKSSPFIAKPDDSLKERVTHITPESIESLENKLGLVDENAS